MAYNPGVQDRSGEILAQGILQGFSSLTQGVERYYKKKEEKEILDSAVTSLMSQAASNPRLAPFIGGANMTDRKAVINAVKGMGGGDVRAGVTALGQSMRQFNIYNQQQQDKEDDQAAFSLGMAARANNEDPLKVLAGSGKKINAGIASLFSNLASADAETARNLAEAERVPASKPPEIKSIKETGTDGRPYDVTYQYNPDGTRVELGRQETNIPSGFNRTSTGDLQPTPGGPAAMAASEKLDVKNEKSAEKAEETRKAVARASSLKAEISQAVQTVNEAIDLVRNNAGGTVAGYAPFRAVNAVFGQPGAKILNSKYTTIQAFTKLSKLAEIRELSRNGASGLGQLSDKEGVALESSVALLDPSLPEEEQLANLKKIKANLMRLGGVPEPGQPGRTATQVGRFTIIPQP